MHRIKRDEIFPPPCRFGVLYLFGSRRPFWLICPGKKRAQKPVLCFGGDRFMQNILYHNLKWWFCIPFLQRPLHIIVRREIGTQSVLWSHYADILPIFNMLLGICVRRSKCEKSVRHGRNRSRGVRHHRRIRSREEMPGDAPVPPIPPSSRVGVTNVYTFLRSWTTEGEQRDPSVVHEPTKNVYTFWPRLYYFPRYLTC